MKAEAALEGPRRALLLGGGVDQRRVEVDEERTVGSGAGSQARSRAYPAGAPQRAEQLGVAGDRLDRAPGGGIGGDRAEERLLVAHGAQVGEVLAAGGEHHREVAHHPAGVMDSAALAHRREAPRERLRQPDVGASRQAVPRRRGRPTPLRPP